MDNEPIHKKKYYLKKWKTRNLSKNVIKNIVS